MLNLIFQLVLVLLAVFGLAMLVIDRKSENRRRKEELKSKITKTDKKVACIIIISTIVGYYILSYLLELDIISFITFRKSGITFSFIGLILFIVTSLSIGFIYEKFRNRNIENNN